jgi:type II secretion system protein N
MAARRAAVAAGIIAGLLLFFIFVIVFIPSGVLQGFVEHSLAKAGYTFRAGEFAKAFPLGVKARRMEIGDDRGMLFKADEAEARLKILPLFSGKVELGFSFAMGEGRIKGEIILNRGGGATFVAGRVRLEDIPFFTTVASVHISGNMDAEGDLTGTGNNAAGRARLEIKGVDLSGVKIGGVPLPDASYETVRGALKVMGGRAVIESFVLQGAGIYVRLSGEMQGTPKLGDAPLNLALEIFPKPDFLERQKLAFFLLERYMVSPGNYRIPIKGTLSHPAIP